MKDILVIAVRAAIAVKETNPIPLFKIWHTVLHHPDVHTLMPPLHIILKHDLLDIMKTLSINPNRFKIWHSMMNDPSVIPLMQALHTEFKDDVVELFLKTIQDPNDNRFQGLEDYDLSDPATVLDQVFQDINQSK